ncbi:MAG: hypothetical protein HGA45_26005 [Chloroflexales bacterium]|nr:hypothetical protein [Chloroflexales bacterium]
MSDDPTTPPPPDPYRPPAPGEKQLDKKVCPDCITDPDHHCEGGLRPIAEFRVIKGKGAARYANGTRLAAYCRYHESKRSMRYQRNAKPKTPEQREDALARGREREARRYQSGRADELRKKRLAELKKDPERYQQLKARRAINNAKWERKHAEERRAYKARWYQQKIDAEIAAGLRPPRGTRRKKRGRYRSRPTNPTDS